MAFQYLVQSGRILFEQSDLCFLFFGSYDWFRPYKMKTVGSARLSHGKVEYHRNFHSRTKQERTGRERSFLSQECSCQQFLFIQITVALEAYIFFLV